MRRPSGLSVALDGSLSVQDLIHVWGRYQGCSKSDFVSELSKICFDSSGTRRFLLSPDGARNTWVNVGLTLVPSSPQRLRLVSLTLLIGML